MEGFVGVRESLREITLLDSFVGPERAFQVQLLAPELIAALALLFDALVDQLVDARQRLFGTGIVLLLGSNRRSHVLGPAFNLSLLAQAPKVSIVLGQKVAISTIDLLNLIVESACSSRIRSRHKQHAGDFELTLVNPD
jgi:hypothetical protein